MPKSKRAKVVSLTQTDKKGLETKTQLVEQIQQCLDEYKAAYIFSVDNMRNAKLKDVRLAWRNSRFFFGKNRVMQRAFGFSAQDEYKPNTHLISEHLKGNVGILFTNKKHEDVVSWFETFAELDYARSGNPATDTVKLTAGPLTEFAHTMEPQLRALGLPTSLKRGIVTLDNDYLVCNKGDSLSPEQARILKLFSKPMAEFKIKLTSAWRDGEFSEL
ncbi:uncharacterized protein MONBRDRAFT_30832 [Monosiga brevicollis MX1]|uniref:Ribosome assembly factor mrt4 n=1 Tax=Monosiga brevicollis TaxID=81824 RepID=A9UPJ4_MONBE|nr:uncharacterized protein MONBRDRAFT_30832 [Monosiga brevicollis MX1]EDQ92433.1 predicted protein [Monosiga brevicollis MX1]|eukprot:XP_001742195.1 hypothetical protein [Monosiga brevicollis MX1]